MNVAQSEAVDQARTMMDYVEAAKRRYVRDDAPTLTEWLAMHVGMRDTCEAQGAHLVGGAMVERYVLEEGEVWHGQRLPDGFEYGEVKMCFKNALELALTNRDLTYVEGYGYAGLIPAQHAWCVDEDGNVIDPTWAHDAYEDRPDPATWEYLGVAFQTEFVLDVVRRKGTYGVLDSPDVYEEG